MIIAFNRPTYAAVYEDVSLFQILLKLLLYLGIFIIVILATVYGTKLIAKNYKGYNNSKYINMLDTLIIPGGIKIIIIKVSKKIYILALSSNGAELMDIIKEEDFIKEDFNSYLDKHNTDNTNNTNNKIKLSINKIIEKIDFSKDREDK